MVKFRHGCGLLLSFWDFDSKFTFRRIYFYNSSEHAKSAEKQSPNPTHIGLARQQKSFHHKKMRLDEALVPCLGHLKSIFGLNLSLYLDIAKNRLKVVQKRT